MAFRRSIAARAKLFSQQQRFATPFPHIHQFDDDRKNPPRNDAVFKNPQISNHLHRRLFGSGNNLGASFSSRNLFHDRRFAIPAGCGPIFARNMSSLGEGPPENIEIMTDKAVDVASHVGPAVNEVAIAAADSSMPVAAIQYLIDYVHCYTGFNWWASIVVTTVLIRSILLPLGIHLRKCELKYKLLEPRLIEIKKEMRDKDMSPRDVAERQARMKELYKEYGVTPFTRWKGSLINIPILCCILSALTNMAANVPSFKEGGALWFTDLSTPDSMFILPILTGLSFWIRSEIFTQPLKGSITERPLKIFGLVFSSLIIPLTAMFSKVICFYFITFNLFSLACDIVLRKRGVKLFLGLPIIPMAQLPPALKRKPGLSFLESIMKFKEDHKDTFLKQDSDEPTLRQQIRNLEKEVNELKKSIKTK
ncbi:hypothetical protein ABFS82_05G110400 [Erythranthe guttata]|uniref:Membrane insertase YidC/Oxa/ALB C-terminal domain-containing protein n=1 Tax=Erythranthe guttata TaxID=4155 RepID=A0A022RJ57_ERYGU|nr:PREDICTED: mitochondrial inner membrane protein OXA1-like [Erythranthe guttata]EYU40019.1 hypothetical protein MIMGU_mgv1a025462mg [Erythranthe guttata]|eukprot:XP_012834265.1 PREDICTED: mitochondrial inner membrane protein OXA1-like [Erythranthe guttata]